jgi:CheY-like chemotaxis protein
MPEPTFEVFEIELQNTLYNLSDPAYTPETCVYQVMGVLPETGMQEVRRQLIETIEREVESSAGETARIHFLYRVLQQRFVFSLSQEKSAEILELSARHLRRKQAEAIRALAAQLWSRNQAVQPPDRAADQAAGGPFWGEMLLREIDVLNNRSPGVTVDLASVIQRTIDMVGHLNPQAGFSLEVDHIPGGLQVAIHPNVLRQVILFVVQQIAQVAYTGNIRIRADDRGAATVISFVTCTDESGGLPEIPHLQELIAVLGGKAAVHQEADQCSLDLIFPISPRKNVLVIDDNYETAQLLRRFTLNTRYEIHHLPSGINLIEQIQGIAPDLLVIDVLLPGQDGWDLLMQLRQDASTADLPVIVSSVIGDPEIARSLGADAYLPKPVSQRDFLQTLERLSKG